MSCPHPRGFVDRVVGDFTEQVCPDCHARPAVLEIEPEALVVLESEYADDLCLLEDDGDVCVLVKGHEGPHAFAIVVEGPQDPADAAGGADPAGPQDDDGGNLAPADEDDSTPADKPQI